MNKRRSMLLGLGLTLLAGSFATAANAQLSEQSLKIIVPFPPGGGSDMFARILSQQLGTNLKRATVIDNKGGAGGSVGASAAARATPDGNTMMYTTASVLINQSLNQNLPYNFAKDFAPLSIVGAFPHILVTSADSGISNLKQLIDAAIKNPNGLFYASPGNGTSTHLTMEWLRDRLGIKLTSVPFKGGAPAVNSVIAGEVPVSMFIATIAKPHIDSGRLIPIATTGDERLSILPDVPTMQELGYPGFVTEQWHATFVPASTPSTIKSALSNAVTAATDTQLMRERIALDGGRFLNLSEKEAQQFLQAEQKKWDELARYAAPETN